MQGDSTELTDFSKWAKSRNIDLKLPHGERPVPPEVEMSFMSPNRHPEYCPQSYIPVDDN